MRGRTHRRYACGSRRWQHAPPPARARTRACMPARAARGLCCGTPPARAGIRPRAPPSCRAGRATRRPARGRRPARRRRLRRAQQPPAPLAMQSTRGAGTAKAAAGTPPAGAPPWRWQAARRRSAWHLGRRPRCRRAGSTAEGARRSAARAAPATPAARVRGSRQRRPAISGPRCPVTAPSGKARAGKPPRWRLQCPPAAPAAPAAPARTRGSASRQRRKAPGQRTRPAQSRASDTVKTHRAAAWARSCALALGMRDTAHLAAGT